MRRRWKIVFCVGEINGEQLCTLSQMNYTLVYHCIIIIRFYCHLHSYAKSWNIDASCYNHDVFLKIQRWLGFALFFFFFHFILQTNCVVIYIFQYVRFEGEKMLANCVFLKIFIITLLSMCLCGFFIYYKVKQQRIFYLIVLHHIFWLFPLCGFILSLILQNLMVHLQIYL